MRFQYIILFKTAASYWYVKMTLLKGNFYHASYLLLYIFEPLIISFANLDKPLFQGLAIKKIEIQKFWYWCLYWVMLIRIKKITEFSSLNTVGGVRSGSLEKDFFGKSLSKFGIPSRPAKLYTLRYNVTI